MLPSKIRPAHVEQRSRLPSSIRRLPAALFSTRILVVDQDRQLGVSLGFMLATRRFDDVRAVRSVKRALAVAEQFRPELVFLDLELPDDGCLAVARQLARDARNHRPRLIALTKHADDPMYEQARAVGFERLLVKPVSHDELDRILGINKATA